MGLFLGVEMGNACWFFVDAEAKGVSAIYIFIDELIDLRNG